MVLYIFGTQVFLYIFGTKTLQKSKFKLTVFYLHLGVCSAKIKKL